MATHHSQEQQESTKPLITLQSPLQQYMRNLLLSKYQADASKFTLVVDNARLVDPLPPKVVDEKPSSRRDYLSKSVSDRSIFQKARPCRWTSEFPPSLMSTRQIVDEAIALTEEQETRSINHTQAPPVTPRRPREKGFYLRQKSDSNLIQPERRYSPIAVIPHTQAPPVTRPPRPREKGFYVRQSSDSALIQPERRYDPNSVLPPF
jgi:hypothetical protein